MWAELVSRGAAVRVEPLYSQARAVAAAMMQRARHNIDLLVPRLQQLGYRFVAPERDYGPMPLVLRVWFEVVGSPDVAFKAHESGGGPVSLLVPNPAFDGPLIDPGERWTGTFFVHHLQTCFEWGGFPGLRGNWYPGQESGAAASQAEPDYLRQDLLPII